MKTILISLIFIIQVHILFCQKIYYKQGSTKKIEQMVGDYDNQNKMPTTNLTFVNYQIWGTDLGVPFEHKGKTYLLFGDIPGDIGFGIDRDPIAYTTDTNPEDGVYLTFLTQEPGLYKPVTIQGIDQGTFNVPLDGISINDTMYIYHSTDDMTRNVLAMSTDDGYTFQMVEDTISTNHFINVSINKITRSDYHGLPGSFENGLIILGTGKYRESAVYLYCQAEDSIKYKESIYYFTGFTRGKAQWSKQEENAEPVFDIDCGGEISTAYNQHLEKWIVLYSCDNPRGIQYKLADVPWGPYSDTEIIFDPDRDDGYCEFIHRNWDFSKCDSVQDPGRENEWGGEYAPYLFKGMSAKEDSLVHIYYTMSTWNPYTTVLMKSTLVKPEVKQTLVQRRNISYFKISPNPTRNTFSLNVPNSYLPDIKVVISDITGHIFLNETKSCEFDLSTFPDGVYIGKIYRDHNYIQSFKVVKTR